MFASLFFGLLFNVTAAQSNDSLTPAEEPGCTLDSHPYCRLVGVIDAETARQELGDAAQTHWREGNVLYVAARRDPGVDSVRMCCGLQTPMEGLGDGIWAAAYQLQRIDEAFVSILPFPAPEGGHQGWVSGFRGPQALPALQRADLEPDQIQARTLPPSTLSAERGILIYRPSFIDERARLPAVYLADGGNVHHFAPIVEAMIGACEIQPVMLVGIENETPAPSSESSRSDLRAADYLWGWDPERFDAMQRFIVDDILPLAEGEYGASPAPENRMISGNSNGAAWALSSALIHPGTFGFVSAGSLGWEDALLATPEIDVHARYFIGAGLFEPGFHTDSAHVAEHLASGGADASFTTYAAGHGLFLFEQHLAQSLREAFPADASCTMSQGH